MYRVVHTVGPFQTGEIITAVQAGPEAARLVALGALLPLDGELPLNMTVELPFDTIGLPDADRSAERFQTLEDRVNALEDRLKDLEAKPNKSKGKETPPTLTTSDGTPLSSEPPQGEGTS